MSSSLRRCLHLSGSLCLDQPSFLPKCIYQVAGPKSVYSLLWASRLLLVRRLVFLQEKGSFQGCWMSVLLLGLLQWGRLSQMGPVNAENFSTLFLALFIRQRLICMQWLAFLAVFWLAYGEFCDELPGTQYLSVSVSHISHVIPQSNHRLLTIDAAIFVSDICVCLLNALRVLLVLCSVAS